MKNLCSLLYILFIPLFLLAQDNIWLTGGWATTNPQPTYGIVKFLFRPDSIHKTIFQTSNSLFLESCNISISHNDSLLFYSNGLTIFNNVHDTMLNSQGFNQYAAPNIAFLQADGDHSFNAPQGTLCLPDLADSNRYHLFHSNYENLFIPPDGLELITYHIDETIIDITGDNGKGTVISKNVPILSGQFAPCYLTACRHGNGKDWWMLIPEFKNNVYRRLLFSGSGIADKGTQNIGTPRSGDEGGIALFSQDGSRYAISNANKYYPLIRLFDFDRCRGLLSNPVQFLVPLNQPNITGDMFLGMSFSPSGRFLYASTIYSVWQYDTWASDIDNSKVKVAEYDGYICSLSTGGGNSYFYFSQLAPNGEIWIASMGGTNVYHIIRHPDSLGLACQVEQHAVVSPVYTSFSIPIYPNYHLGALPDPCPTVGNTAPFGSAQGTGIKVYPNPANHRVHVYLDKAVNLPATFSIFDPYGGEVHHQPLLQPDTEISLGGLGKGMYIYEVITDNYKSYGKLWVE